MIINYKRRDANGNTYNLVVNHHLKTYSRLTGWVSFAKVDILTTKKVIDQVKNELIKNNYKEV